MSHRFVRAGAALWLLACLCSCSCFNEGDEVLWLEGTVRRVEIAGDCWYIQARDGTKYEPLNLPDGFKKDGLEVRFSAKQREDAVTTCMAGRIVELLGIREVSR